MRLCFCSFCSRFRQFTRQNFRRAKIGKLWQNMHGRLGGFNSTALRLIISCLLRQVHMFIRKLAFTSNLGDLWRRLESRLLVIQHAMLSVANGTNMEAFFATCSFHRFFALLQGKIKANRLVRWHSCCTTSFSNFARHSLIGFVFAFPFPFNVYGLNLFDPFLFPFEGVFTVGFIAVGVVGGF